MRPNPSQKNTLVLVNANVLTMESRSPRAQAVAVASERIAAVGDNDEVRRVAGTGAKVVDCQGLTLLPGFNDAHCHVLALARSLQDLDCSPENARSIQELRQLLRAKAGQTAPGQWVRGHSYDDLALVEGRHPTRWDLDHAAPSHPVRLDHRSGHGVVLNSLALRMAGIGPDTPDPVDGVIDRDPATKEPTGLLLEMGAYLRRRLGTLRSQSELKDGVAAANRMLLGYGITSVQDAGADNGLERWRLFRELRECGALDVRLTMFAGADRLNEFTGAALAWGAGDARQRLGHLKVMLTMTTGELNPPPQRLQEIVGRARHAGFPLAFHCIEHEAISAALDALAGSPAGARRPEVPDRIEHCAECPPHLVERIRRGGTTVVTQPGFLYWNGAEYRRRVEEQLLPHLYPANALADAGVPVAFGSDAPVISPNPWPGIYSAVTGLGRDGTAFPAPSGQDRRMASRQALRRYTRSGAEAEGAANEKGTISAGKLADMVLVDADPLTIGPGGLKDVNVLMTLVRGQVVWGGL